MGYYDFPHTRNYDTDLGYLIDWFKTNKNKIEENTAITIEKALTATEEAIKAHNSAIDASNSATNASNSAALALVLKNQTEALKNLMQDKIDQIDTNTNRINNLATIDQGSITTTADAELVDIRVGANGITYPSAGDAVRGQINKLNDDLDLLTYTKQLSATAVGGVYKSGVIDNSLANFKYGTLDVTDFQGLEVELTCTFYATVGFSIYDSSANLIMGINGNDYGSDEFKPRKYSFTMPTNANVLAFTLGKDYSDGLLKSRPITKENIIRKIENYSVINGKYVVGTNGNFASNSNYSISGYIPIDEFVGNTIEFYSYLVDNAGYAVYDKFKNFIKGSGVVSNLGAKMFRPSLEIPENAAYIAFTFYNSISANPSDYPIYILGQTKTDIYHDAIPMSLFTKVGVIGDSFASGEIYPVGGDFYNVSWLQIMARKNGFIGTNYSKGGLTTRTWLTNNKGLPLLQSSDPEQLYIIALGLNDASSLGISYLGSIADMNENYENNPDTFYGNYGKILGNIIAKSINAKIVLSTMPRDYGDFEVFNNAIKEIAKHMNLPVVDINKDKIIANNCYVDTFILSHPTATGYAMMANAYERLMSKAMVDFRSYFADFKIDN